MGGQTCAYTNNPQRGWHVLCEQLVCIAWESLGNGRWYLKVRCFPSWEIVRHHCVQKSWRWKHAGCDQQKGGMFSAVRAHGVLIPIFRYVMRIKWDRYCLAYSPLTINNDSIPFLTLGLEAPSGFWNYIICNDFCGAFLEAIRSFLGPACLCHPWWEPMTSGRM